ncbi:MAG: sensor histidine kinase [Bacteroidales bacterium]|nr:sensor histidine kinase [Bacteroidales bacterium]
MRILTLTYLFVLAVSAPSNLFAQEEPVASKGVLDLREYDFHTSGTVEVKGEFEFYWKQMINPALEGDSGEMIYARVPGSWTSLRKEHPEVSRFGFATYRLIILLPERMDELALRIQDVLSASGYFLNGKAIDYLGFPGVNKYQTVIRYSRPMMIGNVNGQEVELLIRVSNFDNRLSGIVGGVTIGKVGQMQEARQKDLFRGHFLIGAFLIIGIYFLGLYLIRTEHYRLYFSMLCFLMALRVVMIVEIPVIETLNLNGLTAARLDYLNIYFFAPFFILMIRSIFPIEFPQLIYRVSMWVSTVFVIIVVVSPISLFSFTLPLFFVFFILLSAVFLYVILLAWSRGRSHAPAYTLGLLILFFGTLNDMLNEIEVIETAYVVHYTMFVYLLVYAYIFADKSNFLQKKAQKLADEISEVKNHLEDLVEERTTELQSVSKELGRQKLKLETTNRNLVEAMNARNRLFAIIGHDVRAPIGYNLQALEMLIEDPDMEEKERLELLKMMATSSEITYNLLDNLLVWGRSQTGKLKATPVRMKLKDLIDESLELIGIGLKEKHLKVEVYVSEEHYVEADRDQLYIVIRNLMSNAMKFTPEKGSIYISSKKLNGEVAISVRDTGIGIPESMQNKLFDTNAHVSTNGTRGEKGSGLGLAICQEIMQTNGGWMKIDSKSGKGTTITLGVKAAKR